MKIDFVELAGFRGVQDRLRLDLRSGFVVLAGRNGAGKSTIIDAIDFALSGTINRFAVTDAKGGGLQDHIWWMGDGAAAAHYVSVGFSDPGGNSFTVTRDRDRGSNVEPAELLARLTDGEMAAPPRVEVLIQTSIIRDELIAALSLDLPEQARFSAVRSALGAIAGPDFSKRTAAVLSAANGFKDEQQKEIERIQGELGRALSALTEARSATERSADLAEAIRTIRTVPILSSSADNPDAVRKWVAEQRQRLSRVETARTQAENLLPAIDEVASRRRAEEFAAAETARVAAVETHDASVARLAAAEAVVAAEREADEYATHLAAIIEHGATIGLHDGRCPLCDAVRTLQEFDAGLAKARERLAGRAARLQAIIAAVESAKSNVSVASQAVAATSARCDELVRQRTALDSQLSSIRQTYAENGFDVAVDQPGTVQRQILDGQEQLAGVERALFVLEASSSIDRVGTLEARVAALKDQSDKAATRLSELEKGVENARQIDASSKTVLNQMLEEQFDTVMPLLKELYRRLRPHPDWLDIEADFGGRVRASLNFVVGNAGNPQFLFSSGQRRAAGLAFLLAIHLSRRWCNWNSLLLDDPVQHIDDYRALNLAEVLASIRRTGRQVIVAVEDAALADVLCRRLRSSVGGPGRRIDLRIAADGRTEAESLDIPPLSSHVLQQAKAS